MHPSLLTLIFLPHFVKYHIVFLRAVVRFGVLGTDSLIVSSFLTGPFSLLVDKVLVNTVVSLSISLSFGVLRTTQGKVTVELIFFILTPLSELKKIFLITVKGSK